MGFLDWELSLLGREDRIADHSGILDTLELARDLHPGQRNSLDALCKRYDVDNSSRTLHGALLDAEILADVYLAMTGGQTDLGLSFEIDPAASEGQLGFETGDRPPLKIQQASDAELAAHSRRLEAIREKADHCLWLDQ